MDRNNYKKIPTRMQGDARRLARAQQHDDRRREQRAQHVANHRGVNVIIPEPEPQKEETVEDRMAKLMKWKAERDLKKKMEAAKKTPIFKFGVPHHNFYSPKAKDPPVPHCHTKQCRSRQGTPIQPRVTRATQKRLAAKQQAALSNPGPSTSKAVPKNSSKATPKSGLRKKKSLPSIAPVDYIFRGPSGIVPIQLFGKIPIPSLTEIDFRLENGKKEIDSDPDDILKDSKPEMTNNNTSRTITADSTADNENALDKISKTEPEVLNPIRVSSPVPAQFSPFIVASRGKSSARKEQKERMGLNNSLSEDIPTKETVMQALNISIEEEEKQANYYKYLLENETTRLTDLCEKWQAIQKEPETTEDGQYLINQAIGQTKLLLRKKFERFRSLVHDCETGKGEMLVRCRDLQGFWDTLSMEIKNCESRFEKVEEARAKNWAEESEDEMPVVVVKKEKKPVAKKKPKIAGKSNFRAFIEAARQKKMAEPNDVKENENIEAKPIANTSKASQKQTPQSRRHSKSTEQLLDTSLTLMKISNMSKTPEVKLDNTISYINSGQTPGRGILKQAIDLREACLIKSTQKVNFYDSVVMNGTTQWITEPLPPKGVEKKLDFEDETFMELEDQSDEDSKVERPPIFIIPSTPFAKSPKRAKEQPIPVLNLIEPTPESKTPKADNSRTPERIDSPPIRVLRSRSVVTHSGTKKKAPNTPRRGRRSQKKAESLEDSVQETLAEKWNDNGDNEAAKENACPTQGEIEKNNTELHNRRSTRKSVKFDVEEDCTACSMMKPVLPSTPKRHRNLSLLGDMNKTTNTNASSEVGDLISFDSPVIPTPRRRRPSRN